MTIAEFRERYAGLDQKAVRHMIQTDATFKMEIENLYRKVFKTLLNGRCSDCTMDGYILLMKSNIDNLMAKQNTQFALRAGALLLDPENVNDNSKICSQANITDELALYHLAKNPSCRRKFIKLPDNVDELVAEYAKKLAGNANKSPEGASNAESEQSIAEAEKVAEKATKPARKSRKK